MSDLISRQSVLDKFKALCDACGEGEKYNGVMCRCCALDDGICIVEDAPDAEPERKKGEWISVESNTVNGRCSVCGYESHLYENDVYGEHYCPNCGAWLRLT